MSKPPIAVRGALWLSVLVEGSVEVEDACAPEGIAAFMQKRSPKWAQQT